MCRELNSHLFAFFKNHFSLSRTDSSHVSNSGSVLYLAQSSVPYVSEIFKNIRTYKKNDIKNLQFLYCFRKTPSKFAFFKRKMAKCDMKFLKTLMKFKCFSQKRENVHNLRVIFSNKKNLNFRPPVQGVYQQKI